jgi:hypothetical protein
MIALLLAAQVVAAAPPIAERTPNLYSQPAHCPAIVAGELERQKVAFRGQPPGAQYAVERRLDGCGVPTPIGYHPPYLLPGAADPTSKRGDAPANRR